MKPKAPSPTTPGELIAPCGMNCALCSRYLAYVHHLNRSQCAGCRPSNKHCTYLFAKCSGLNANRAGNADAPFCGECELYPCAQIECMDKRYRSQYGMSIKETMNVIVSDGPEALAQRHAQQFACPKCGDVISIHNRRCFRCESITRLVEKQG